MRPRVSATALLSLLALPVMASAHAADTPVAAATAEADADMTTVVVQGERKVTHNSLSKLPADLHDVSQSVTVLNKSLLQSQGVTSLADALHNVPGITLGGAEGGQIGNNINLNGFTARTDIYLDGFRDRGQYYRDTFALENVEVLMGPSSMLFGRGSTGGAISQVTRKPTLASGADGSASLNSNGLARGTVGVNQPLSGTAAMRIDLMAQNGAPATRKDMVVRDYGVAPSLKFGIKTPTEITISGLYQHNNDRPDYGLPPLNGHPAGVDRDTVYGYRTDKTVSNVAALSAEIKHTVSDSLTLRDQLQFNSVDTNAIETAPQTIGTVNGSGFHALAVAATSPLPLDQLSVRLQSHDRDIHDKSLYNQAELTGNFDTGSVNHAILLGAEFGHDSYRNQGFYRNGTCNGVALNPATGTSGYVACVPLINPGYGSTPANVPETAGNLAGGEADTTGIYASDTLSFGKAFKLVAGLRYDKYEASISNSLNAANTPGNTSFAALHQTVDFTSVRLGGIWQPAEDTSYYVSYSTSFNPSLEQLTSTTGLTQPLPPETNKAYELGGKWEAAHDRLSLTAAAFSVTQDNSRSQNADNTYTANGTIRVQGVRFGASGKITDTWQVFGGYTHLDARVISAIAPGTLGMIPGNTPKDSATVWSTYDISHDWQVGGGAIYVSSRFDNNTDTTEVGGYTRWDATVAWRQPKYDLRLNLFNLFDTHYYDALIQSDGGRSVPGTGRTVLLSLNWHL